MNDSTLMRWVLKKAREERVEANTHYLHAIALAKEQGWGNTQIARAMGCSETAIRMYWKRHQAEIESGTTPLNVITRDLEKSDGAVH